MSESWVEKHRPREFDDIQGNTTAIKHIEEWAENWTEGDEPQLLHGKPGTGKTTTALVVADKLGYPLNEVNVSSARKSDDIKRISSLMRSAPADGGNSHQLILLDEVDSWHHASNKRPLYKSLRDPKNPIILTANAKYDVPDPIEEASEVHKFSLRKSSKRAKIQEIAEREGMDLSKEEIESLAERSDLRSAINDLQRHEQTDGRVNFDTRTGTKSEFDAIQNLISAENEKWKESLRARTDTFRDPGSALQWADEAARDEYRGLEAGVVHDTISRGDKHLGKARRSQDYRYWKYASALASEVPEGRLTEPYDGEKRVDHLFPSWFKLNSKKWDDGSAESELYRSFKEERTYSIACSYFEFRNTVLPILKDLPMDEKKELALHHGLSEDAIELLGVPTSEFDDWVEVEEIETGEWSPETDSASLADW